MYFSYKWLEWKSPPKVEPSRHSFSASPLVFLLQVVGMKVTSKSRTVQALVLCYSSCVSPTSGWNESHLRKSNRPGTRSLLLLLSFPTSGWNESHLQKSNRPVTRSLLLLLYFSYKWLKESHLQKSNRPGTRSPLLLLYFSYKWLEWKSPPKVEPSRHSFSATPLVFLLQVVGMKVTSESQTVQALVLCYSFCLSLQVVGMKVTSKSQTVQALVLCYSSCISPTSGWNESHLQKSNRPLTLSLIVLLYFSYKWLE